jgi:mRNA interferase MazF
VLTRDAAAAILERIVVAQITRTVRGIRSEVPVGRQEGLGESSVINCDNVLTIRRSDLDPMAVGRLGPTKERQLDRALCYALDIKS